MRLTEDQLRAVEKLSRRSWEIFREIVRQYIFDGCPVGSQSVAESWPERISSASVRKIMVELEEAGLIFQPHVSAGRVPTDLGYRCYVERFVSAEDLEPSARFAVQHGLASGDVPRILDAASRLLSGLSRHVGVVVAPYLHRMRLHNIEFVRVNRTRILAVFVSQAGSIVNRVVELESSPPQEELEKFARLLVDEFRGRTLPGVRDEMRRRLSVESRAWDRLARSAMGLGLTALSETEDEEGAEVFVEGTASIFDLAGTAGMDRLRVVFEALERRERIVELLDRCLDQDGVGALIGSESGEDDLVDLAVIAANYRFRGEPVGTLGIIGPTRMEYEKNLALVKNVAETVSGLLTETKE